MFKFPANKVSGFVLIIAALSLAACGGGGGGSTVVRDGGSGNDTPEDTSSGNDDFSGGDPQEYFREPNAILKAGVFTAEVVYTDGRENLVGPMILSATGNFTFPFGADFVTSGTLSLEGSDSEGSDFGGPVVEYELMDNEWRRSTGVIAGFVPSSGSNESAMLDTGALVDVINITRQSDANVQDLSFEQIAGRYETTGPDPQINIDVEGRIDGFDRGCVLEGNITIPAPEIDVFELSYTASSCTDLAEATGEERTGEYRGVGTFTPATSESGANITFASSNGKIAFYFAGTM